MATPPGTPPSPPGTPPSPPGTPTPPPLPFIDEASYTSSMNAAREFSKVYEGISELLKDKGPKAALEYIKVVNDLTTSVITSSDKLKGYSEALGDNAERFSQAYNQIKRTLREQTEALIKTADAAKTVEKAIDSLLEGEDEISAWATTISDGLDDVEEKFFETTKTLGDSQESIADTFKKIQGHIIEIKTESGKTADEQEDSIKKVIEAHKQEMRTMGIKAADIDKLSTYTKEYARQLSLTIDFQKAAYAQDSDESKKAAAVIDLLLRKRDLKREEKKLLEDIKETQDQVTTSRAEKESADAQEKTNKNLENFLDKITGATKGTGFFSAALIAAATNSKSLGTSLGDSLTKAFLDPEKAAARLANFIDKTIIKPTLEFDKLFADINKTSGGYRKEAERAVFDIRDGGNGILPEMHKLGITAKELTEAYGGLSNSVGGFNNLSDLQKEKLIASAATMNNLGVSFDAYGTLVKKYMGNLGDSSDEAIRKVKELSMAALNAGKNVNEYLKEFDSLSPKLFGYTRDMAEIYSDLNAISQATSGIVSATQLEAVAGKFRYFADAQKSISEIGLALNGITPQLERVMAKDPATIIAAVNEAIQGYEGGFEGLNKIQQDMIANALGMSSMQVAAISKISDMDIRLQKLAKNSGPDQLLKKQEDSVAAQKQLNAAIDNMTLSLSPALSAITMLADGIAGLSKPFGPTGPILTGIGLLTIGIGIAFKVLTNSIVNSISTAMSALRIQVGEQLVQIQAMQSSTGMLGGAFSGTRNLAIMGGTILGATLLAGYMNSSSQAAENHRDPINYITRPATGQGVALSTGSSTTMRGGIISSNMNVKHGPENIIDTLFKNNNVHDGASQKFVTDSRGNMATLDPNDALFVFNPTEQKQISNMINNKYSTTGINYGPAQSFQTSQDSDSSFNYANNSSFSTFQNTNNVGTILEKLVEVLNNFSEAFKENNESVTIYNNQRSEKNMGILVGNAYNEKSTEMIKMLNETVVQRFSDQYKTETSKASLEQTSISTGFTNNQTIYLQLKEPIVAKIDKDSLNSEFKKVITAAVHVSQESPAYKAGLKAHIPDKII